MDDWLYSATQAILFGLYMLFGVAAGIFGIGLLIMIGALLWPDAPHGSAWWVLVFVVGFFGCLVAAGWLGETTVNRSIDKEFDRR